MWPRLLNRLLADPNTNGHGVPAWVSFWESIIDGQFFLSFFLCNFVVFAVLCCLFAIVLDPNHEYFIFAMKMTPTTTTIGVFLDAAANMPNKLMAIYAFDYMVCRVPLDQVKHLFSRNFMINLFLFSRKRSSPLKIAFVRSVSAVSSLPTISEMIR